MVVMVSGHGRCCLLDVDDRPPSPCASTNLVLCLGLLDCPWKHCDRWHYSGLSSLQCSHTISSILLSLSRMSDLLGNVFIHVSSFA